MLIGSRQDPTAELAIVGYLLLQPAAAAELRPLLPAHALATPWLRAAYEAALQGQLLQHCAGLTLWQLRAALEGAAAGPECCRALE